METDERQEFFDYWDGCKNITVEQKSDDDTDAPLNSLEDEVASEAEWLVLAGLPHLSDAFLNGRLIEDNQLQSVAHVLAPHQINAVRRRVNSLNQTIKHRSKSKYRKPDIRDVFKNAQNNPDENSTAASCDTKISVYNVVTSIKDSGPRSLPICPLNDEILTNSISNDVIHNRERARNAAKTEDTVVKHEMFRKRPEGDIVAYENVDGIRMLAFQKLDTLRHFPYNEISEYTNRINNEDKIGEEKLENSLDCNSLGFEQLWQLPTVYKQQNAEDFEADKEELLLGRTWIDTLDEEDVTKLKPLLFMELSAIFDRASIPFPKIKRRKKKKGREGSIFGVCLELLLERDQSLLGFHSCRVPMIFTKILNEIEKRGIDEQGLLRVAGHKVKVDVLCQEIEKHFYSQVEEIDQLLQRSAIHDLTAVLKKLLRDLPEPILTTELINLFYQLHYVPAVDKALNLLTLLLPPVNRLTLLAIISFMCTLTEHEENNKMSLHNVAMIIAPSLFPRRCIQKSNKDATADLKGEIELAAVSCRVTELLMKHKDRLNVVPTSLISQLRQMNDFEKYKSKTGEDKKVLNFNKKIIHSSNVVIHVDAPQFDIKNCPITLDSGMTAGDLVLRMIDINSRSPIKNTAIKQARKKDFKQRVLTELVPNGNLSCFLSTADPETAIETHFLYEHGGNIGKRRIEPSALLMAVYQKNSAAHWVIHCDHRNGLKHIS